MSKTIWIHVAPGSNPTPCEGLLLQYRPDHTQAILRVEDNLDLVESETGKRFELREADGTVRASIDWIERVAGIIKVRNRKGPRLYKLKSINLHNLLIVSEGAKDFRLFANGAKRVKFSASADEAIYHCGRNGRVVITLLDGGASFKFDAKIGDARQEYILRTPSELARALRDFCGVCALADAPFTSIAGN